MVCSLFVSSQGSSNALSFNGSSNIVQIPYSSSLNFSTNFSVTCWVYPMANSYRRIISKYGGGGGIVAPGDFLIDTYNPTNNGRGLRFWMTGPSIAVNYSVTAANVLTLNQWNHIAATFDNGLLRVYVNGIMVLSGTAPFSALPVNTNVIRFGEDRNVNAPEFYQGSLDEVTFWNTTLAQTEIRDWMCKSINATHTQYGSLAAYYKLDEGTGTSITDHSVNGNNGVFINAPTWIVSGAPIGDESSHDYGNANNTTVTHSHSDGSHLTISSFTGTPIGAHVYLVNSSPNSTTVALSGGVENTRYYGTFIIGGTTPTYRTTYNYTGNNNIEGSGNEADSRIAERTDNSVSVWSNASSRFDLNTASNEIMVCAQSGRKEYLAGFQNSPLPESPGSGYTLNLNGSNQYVSIPASAELNPTSQITLEAWYRPTVTWTGNGIEPIVLKSFTSHTPPYYQYGIYAIGPNYPNPSAHGQFRFILSNSSNTIFSVTTPLNFFTIGEWYHIVGTYDGSTMKLYVNGMLIASSAASGNIASFNTGVEIGKLRNFNTYLPGQVDEVRIWSTALTQNEIRDWMCKKINTDHPQLCRLIAYYNFDEGGGSNLTDITGSSHNGTLINSPVWNYSGAPIGNEAIWVEAPSVGSSLNLSHPNGDDLTAEMTSGSANLMQLYRVDETPNTTTPPGTFDQLSQINYFGVKLFGSVTGVYTITYNYDGHPGIFDENNLGLASRPNNSILAWTEEPTTVLNTAANTLTLSGQTGTEFILGSTSLNPLPIDLLSFDAIALSNKVELSWRTLSEHNNDYFTIERSKDQVNWRTIALVDGAGNSNEELNYKIIDDSAPSGQLYYRLSQTDYDGAIGDYKLRSVFVVNDALYSIYPNPCATILAVQTNEQTIIHLSLFDLNGRELVSLDDINKESALINLSQVDQGNYYLIIETDEQIIHEAITVLR